MTVDGLLLPGDLAPAPTSRDFLPRGRLRNESARRPAGIARFERLLAFLVPFAAFLTAGTFLSLHYHSVMGDAAAREANGYYVLFSNDPHLAAIGFVWNPLTTISEMPLMLLKGIWPALTVDAFAANVMSSLFMAAASYQLLRFMDDLGTRPLVRWALLACFLLDPMIIFYGSNGMSEALFIFTLLATARHLALYLRNGTLPDLVWSGIWLGLAYAVRNEAAMAAAFASVLVAGASYLRSHGPTHRRRMEALTDTVLFAGPFCVSFVGWAGVSWLIVGHPFEQFQSVYGNSSQLRILNAGHATTTGYLLQLALHGALSLAPLLPVVALAASARAVRERDPRILAILAVLGGVVTFEVGGLALGKIDPQYRYLIYTIPLMILLAAFWARPLGKSPAEVLEEQIERCEGRTPPYLPLRRQQRLWLSKAAALSAVIMVIPGALTTYSEMFHSTLGGLEADALTWVLFPGSHAARFHADEQVQYAGIRQETARLDSLRGGRGAIMVDDSDDCIPNVILASEHPTEFEIPNDVNFAEVLGAPYQHGVRYMLVSNAHGSAGTLDALDREWPTLYDTGAGLGTLVSQTTLPNCGTYRLYRLAPQVNS